MPEPVKLFQLVGKLPAPPIGPRRCVDYVQSRLVEEPVTLIKRALLLLLENEDDLLASSLERIKRARIFLINESQEHCHNVGYVFGNSKDYTWNCKKCLFPFFAL